MVGEEEDEAVEEAMTLGHQKESLVFAIVLYSLCHYGVNY